MLESSNLSKSLPSRRVNELGASLKICLIDTVAQAWVCAAGHFIVDGNFLLFQRFEFSLISRSVLRSVYRTIECTPNNRDVNVVKQKAKVPCPVADDVLSPDADSGHVATDGAIAGVECQSSLPCQRGGYDQSSLSWRFSFMGKCSGWLIDVSSRSRKHDKLLEHAERQPE